ncbi:Transcriptional regulator, NifA subfamily, Fis Family [Candidatus Sulfopaludibacter sp. SbA3]|nr:Transcriptional regulator, NifA subfamily, Fis Family [Candidatus Sulfopaludibacter sp. SbA3]
MNHHLRVLIVEDSRRDFELILRELRLAGYDPLVERVQTESEMADCLKQQTWEVIFSDHSLPEFDAAHALQLLQASGLDIPFIIISGMIGEERAVDLMKAGANDYVSKQNLTRLIPVLERELRESTGRRERRRVELELAALNRERERMLNQRSTLLDINNAVIANLDRQSLFRAVFRAVRRTLPCNCLLLTLRDSDTGVTQTVTLGEPEASDQRCCGGEGVFEPSTWVLENGRPLLRADLTTGLQFPGEDILLAQGTRSYMSAPLQTYDKPFGALTITNRTPGELTDDETVFFSQVCRQVSMAIENMLSFEQIARLKSRLERENAYLLEEIKAEHNFEEMVGSSAPLKALIDKIQRVAPTDATVLITGESGTGKELVARALHSRSARRSKPLVKINCAAISAGLVESELFGHVKGAFTGALDRRVGRFEFADGGTLFLDEVGELPLDTQVKLLRVLQEHEFEPVGSNRTVRVDVRVIAATNRRLEEAVKEGRFRADLFFRLNVVPIELPPLRDRRSDIPDLTSFILSNCNRQFGKRIDSVAEETLQRLINYDWPGNVRELQNVLARAVVLSSGPVLRLGEDFLPRAHRDIEAAPRIPLPDPPPAPRTRASKATGDLKLEDVERQHIVSILERTHWVIEGPNGAAALLALHPNTLRSRMKRLNIQRPSHPIS